MTATSPRFAAQRLLPPLATAVVWALAAASVVGWGVRMAQRSTPLTTPAAVDAPAPLDATRIAQWLGAPSGVTASPTKAVEAAPSRLQLVGVVAEQTGGDGVALIAIDGAPPKPFALGRVVQGDWVVQRVTARRVDLGPRGGAVAQTLEMPLKPPPATLPTAGALAPVAPAPSPAALPAPVAPVAPMQPSIMPSMPVPTPHAPVPMGAPTAAPTIGPAVVTQRDGNLAPSTLPQAVPSHAQ